MRLILIFLTTLALPAWAADTGSTAINLHAFTPPAGDISVDFLHQIFGISDDGIGAGGSTVIGAMMYTFNDAVLLLCMLFVIFTTVKGTLDSAHTGEILGKKMSEIWVPIRTIGGTAMLLPLASGYSLIQMWVLWLSMQGFGVADATFQAAMSKFATTGTLGHVSMPDARPLAANILRAEVCMAAMNKQYEAEGRTERIAATKTTRPHFDLANNQQFKPTGLHPIDTYYSTAIQLADSFYTTVDYSWQSTARKSSAAACGSLSWQESQQGKLTADMTQAARAPIMQSQTQAVAAMIQELRPVAQTIVAWQQPTPGAVDIAAMHYEDAIAVAAKAAIDASPDIAQQSFIKHAETGGWILAGTWFNHMLRVNDTIQSTTNMIPVSNAVGIEDLEVKDALTGYRDAMAFTDEYLKDRSASPRQSYETEVSNATSLRSGDDAWRLLSVPAMAGLNNLTQSIAGANTSPLTQLRVIGNDIISIGTAMKTVMFALAGFAGSRASDWTVGNVFNVTEALKTMSGTVEFASSSLWALGSLLAFYLPAVPAIFWVAGVIRCLATVVEAVLAAPLMAAMHVHPSGDDVVGRAGPGYMLILSMIMQPTLLVLGFILAALMTYPAGALVNMMFLSIVSGITGSSAVGIVSLVAFTGLYVVMMIMAIHGCFALISAIPGNVMAFVGSQAGAQGIGSQQAEKGFSGLEGGVAGAGVAAAKGKAERSGGVDSKPKPKPGGGVENGLTNADHMPGGN